MLIKILTTTNDVINDPVSPPAEPFDYFRLVFVILLFALLTFLIGYYIKLKVDKYLIKKNVVISEVKGVDNELLFQLIKNRKVYKVNNIKRDLLITFKRIDDANKYIEIEMKNIGDN